ncbi:hypothetical protein AWENTII_009507 [Aspergillus wentii]
MEQKYKENDGFMTYLEDHAQGVFGYSRESIREYTQLTDEEAGQVIDKFKRLLICLLNYDDYPLFWMPDGIRGEISRCALTLMEILVHEKGKGLEDPPEELVEAAAGNWTCGAEAMQIPFDQNGANLSVSNRVVEAAAGNTCKEVMQMLYNQLRENLPVSEKAVEEAAGNVSCAVQILSLFLSHRTSFVPSQTALENAAQNGHQGPSIMKMLLDRGKNVPISIGVFEAAKKNLRRG